MPSNSTSSGFWSRLLPRLFCFDVALPIVSANSSPSISHRLGPSNSELGIIGAICADRLGFTSICAGIFSSFHSHTVRSVLGMKNLLLHFVQLYSIDIRQSLSFMVAPHILQIIASQLLLLFPSLSLSLLPSIPRLVPSTCP